MYKKSFYIKAPLGNNQFHFHERKNKKLFVPSLKKINDFSQIELWKQIVFEDFDFHENLISAQWLKNFYHIIWNNKNMYLFDNHNHALYFWYLSRYEWIIWNNNILYHIDEHADTRIPEVLISNEESKDMKKVFEYTNFHLNVGNYIIPAQHEWIIWKIIQIRSQTDLENNISLSFHENDIIFNLDLDFFEPNLDYIEYSLKKKVIRNIAKQSKIITIATSPFFIDQNRAIEVFKDLFSDI